MPPRHSLRKPSGRSRAPLPVVPKSAVQSSGKFMHSGALEAIPKILATLAVLVSVAALIHEWGFYTALGLELSQSPIGISDQFKNVLALIPSIVRDMSLVLLVAMLLAGFGEVDEKTFKGFWSPLRDPYRFFASFIGIASSAFLILDALQPQDGVNPAQSFGLLVLALMMLAVRFELNGPDKGPRYIAVTLVLLAYLPFWLFGVGQNAARRSETTYQEVTVVIKDSGAKAASTIHGSLLRSYEKYLLLRSKTGEVFFQSTERIERIEIASKPPRKGLICIWFSLGCP